MSTAVTQTVKKLKGPMALVQRFGIDMSDAQQLVDIDITPSKADAMKLAKFYKEGGHELETIVNYYTRFAALKARNRITPDINAFKTFEELEHEVDAKDDAIQVTSTAKADIVEPIFTNEYLEVFLTKNAREAAAVGSKYTFCICRDSTSSNMFNSYRGNISVNTKVGDKATGTYFVRLKKRLDGTNVSDEKDASGKWINPEHMIVFHVGDKMRWTFADNGSQGGGTRDVTKEQVIEKFPEMKVLFGGLGEFPGMVPDQFGEQEIRIYQLLKVVAESLELFKKASYEEKLLIITNGGTIPIGSYGELNADLRNELFKRMTTIPVHVWKEMTYNDKHNLIKSALNSNNPLRSESGRSELAGSLIVMLTQDTFKFDEEGYLIEDEQPAAA